MLSIGVLGGALFVLSRTGTRQTRNPAGHGPSTGGAVVGSGGTAEHHAKSGHTLALADGQYLYVRWTTTMTGWNYTQQSWWATDGSGRTAFDCSVDPCQDPACGPNFCDGYSGPPNETYGPGQYPTDDDMSGLSTDPQVLLGQLLARTAPGGKSPEPAVSPGPELTPGVTAGGLLYAISSLLADPNGTPELKAAVFEVATGIDAVNVTTGAADPAGRPATMLEFSLDGSAVHRLYFDPGTHLLMADAWSDSDTTTVYDQGIVTSTESIPHGGEWLFPRSPRG